MKCIRNGIIIGDMNINVLIDSAGTKKYIDTIVSNGYILLNDIDTCSATRVAQHLEQ